MNLIKTKSFELAIYTQGNPNSEKFALVLPGKLDTKDYSHMRSHVEYLANQGYFALSFDPPGTWESPGDIRLYTMTNYLKVINELIESYGNKPTFLMGHSRGGTMAILVGTSNPLVTGFVAIFSGFINGRGEEDLEWKEKGMYVSMRDLPPGGGSKEKQFELPYSFLKDERNYDITQGLETSDKPKLFMLGLQDNLVQPQIIRETYNLAAEPKQLYEMNSNHDYRHDQTLIEEVNNRVGKFIKDFNL